jgi:hypothetical protein
LWRYYFRQAPWCGRVPQKLIGVVDDGGRFDWKEFLVAAYKQKFSHLSELMFVQHLKHRLALPMSDRKWLGLFVRVRTEGTRSCMFGNEVITRRIAPPPIILCAQPETFNTLYDNLFLEDTDEAEDLHRAAKVVEMLFQHKQDLQFLYFHGEGGVHSQLEMYAVDKTKNPHVVEIPSLIHREVGLSPCKSKTLLSKSQYQQVGELLHQDKNYYEQEGDGFRYNYATGHSVMRNGGARSGVASCGKSYNKPNIRVTTHSAATMRYPLQTLCLAIYDIDLRTYSDGPNRDSTAESEMSDEE